MNLFKSALMVAALGVGTAQAADVSDVGQAAFQAVRTLQVAQSQLANRINWQVGDFHKLGIQFLFGGGEGSKLVTKDEPTQNAVWYTTEIALMGQNQKTEALISREDGRTLKLIVNGKEEDPTAGGEIEIIEQSETSVEVPAGKFDCFYIKANVTAKGQKSVVEIWVNPVNVNIDGTLKMVAQTQFGPLTLTLKEFGHQ